MSPLCRPQAVSVTCTFKNLYKSEVVILGTSHQLRAAANIQTIDVAGRRLAVSDRVKSLGVTIDSNLRFEGHAYNLAQSRNYDTRALRHMCSLPSDDVVQTVTCSIVASRLDYCNALLYGAPTATINKLQRGHRTNSPVLFASMEAAPTSLLFGSRYTGCR